MLETVEVEGGNDGLDIELKGGGEEQVVGSQADISKGCKEVARGGCRFVFLEVSERSINDLIFWGSKSKVFFQKPGYDRRVGPACQ